MQNKTRLALTVPALSLCLFGATLVTEPAFATGETFRFPSSAGNQVKGEAAERFANWRKKLAERRQDYKSRLTNVEVERSGVRKTEKSNSKNRSKKTGAYSNLISKYARQHGVPYNLARSVVKVESSFRPNVTGAAGEIGLMQIKLSTARGMGYKGTRKQLYDPATNLFWGMKYLGRAHALSGGTICGTILKYNAGHGAKRMNPVSSRYCQKVKRNLGVA